MQSAKMEKKGGNCIICFKLLDSDLLTVTENILNLFKFLAETILDTTVLQNGLMCSACLEDIKEAVNFKHLAKQRNSNVEIKQETFGEDNLVICYICKDGTKQNSFTSLFNSCYENIASYMIQKETLGCLVNPQICNTCHISALNFERMTRFLSVYDLNKSNNDQLNSETVTTDESEFKIDIVDHCLPAIKEEFTEIEQDFQKKQELNLKMTCEVGPSAAGFRSFKCEDQERSSVLQQPENLIADTNESNLTTNIDKIEMNYEESSNRLMFTHKNINEVKIFKCKICEFQTKYKGNIKNHALTHKNINEVKLFKCHNCEFKTKHKRYLKQHLLTHDNICEVEMFKCHNCDFQTKHKRSLELHMLTHNNEIKMFKCQNCEFQTKRKYNIKTHMLSHKNMKEVKMFKCESCEFHTKYKKNLKGHAITHKNINEVKRFKCHNCEFETNYKVSLKQHMFTQKHTNKVKMIKGQNCELQTKYIVEVKKFKCHNCEYQARKKSNLISHLLTHKNIYDVKMFKCQNCRFQTKHKHNLTTHLLTHKNINEVQTFKCDNCEFQTKYTNSFKRHILTHEIKKFKYQL